MPDAIGASSVYFVVTNPRTGPTGSGARVHATDAAVIRNGPHLGGNNDWSIRVLIPDLCASLTDYCEGPNGPMQGQTLTMVIDDDAGIKNPSEAGSYGVGYSLLGPADNGNRGPEVLLEDLPTYAKISLSDFDNRRGYALTVTGSGFNDGTTAAVYVLHDPSVGTGVFDNGSNEAALCERIVLEGTRAGGALVGSDDRVSVTFMVTAPTFGPGNANYICMVDGEGRMSHTDVERFHLEHWIRVSPSNLKAGDTATIFAQDFPNTGVGFTSLKLAGRTATASVSSSTPIGADASATVTFTVPDGLVGTISVEATWGSVSASAHVTIVDSVQSPAPAPGYPPPATNIRVSDGANPGEVVIAWDAVPDATHYRIGYVNMVTDYPLAKASRTGNWLEAFIYVDVEAQNFTVVGGRTEYTIRRLEQGVRHAFTVRTGDSPHGDYAWPSNPRWKFHVVADRGGACLAAASNTTSASPGQSTSTEYFDQSQGRSWSISRHSLPDIQWPGTHWNIAAIVSSSFDPEADSTVSPTGNIAVRDGHNAGEVVISWDAVLEATHYRIGYVNMVTDYPLAKASRTGNWLEAFVYVDVEAQNFTVVGGRTEYTIRRLEQGVRHAFTVRTGDSPYGDYAWPSNPRWKFHTVADRGEACPSVSPMPDPTFETERTALAALYEATGGAHWSNNTNWLSEKPVGDWYGVATDDAGRVIRIHLRENQLTGQIPSQLGNLVSLTVLDIANNQLSGPIPPQLGNLANLTRLSLFRNELSGQIPSQLGNLANLKTLSVSVNQLSGPIPSQLGNLANLTRLYLFRNELSGPIPPQLGNLASVESLVLYSNQLTGPIPSQLGNLASLQTLDLRGNQLSGPIPSQLGNLANLERLDLDSNQLSGPIPSQLGNLASLQTLDLRGNQLSGPIPSQLGNLANLERLDLDSNQLSGPIPSQLGNLANLERLDLGGNLLSGPIPSQLGNLANLTGLYLFTNELSGPIPPELGNLANLERLYLFTNELSGPIPPELGNLANLTGLYLGSNQLSGPIPSQLGNLVNLTHLELGGNQFSGCVPRELQDVRLHGVSLPVCDGDLACTVHTTTDGIFAEAKWSDVPTELNGSPLTGYEVLWTISGIGGTRSEPLVRLGKSHTQTSLTVPGATTPQAVQFSLRGVYSQQSGEYIHESCVNHQLERATLVSLYIATGGENWTYDHNWLSHQEVGAWSGVRTGHNGRVIGLSLHHQGLSGEIPKSLANLRSLRKLELVGNQLTGPIPVELSELTDLTSLVLSQNQLSGQVPLQLGNLLDLRELNLHGNQLTGTIPSRLGNPSRLMTLSLHGNQLSGTIPPELGMLGSLTVLDLGNNQLTGMIPRDLANLVELQVLALGANELSGQIPSELGNLTKLHSLDLSWNQLGGEIPKGWGNITYWREWHVIAGNNFTGCIPYGMQFAPGDPGDSGSGDLPFCSP